jgi:hypothetical protein
MLKHYSHIRIDARRQALDAAQADRDGHEWRRPAGRRRVPPSLAAALEVRESATSQFAFGRLAALR